jgi:hypothetical protein
LLLACTDSGTTVPPPDKATGSLDAWQPAAPLPTARANHCIAAIDDWVLVIGGNHKQGADFVKTDEIHAAQLSADGVLGPWQLAGKTPSPVSECSATSDGRTLYLVDGLYDVETDARQVFAADLDDTGKLGALVSIATLPQIAISSEATVHADQLLMMDTVLPADGDATVTLRTSLAGGTWATDDWHIGFRAQAQYAFAEGFAYTIGGYKGDTGNPVTDEVFFAPIGADGVIGATSATSLLPAPTAFGEAVAVDDFVFVVGGRNQVFGAAASTAVYSAHIEGDGSLAPWVPLAALPFGRTNHELAVVGDFLVIAGGADAGGGDDKVLVTRVRYQQNSL